MLSDQQIELIRHLATAKTKILLFAKHDYPFFTDLPNFQKPKEIALLGYFSKKIFRKNHQFIYDYFDQIFWFKEENEAENSTYENIAQVFNFVELEELLQDLIKIVPQPKLRVVAWDDTFCYTLSVFREKYQIIGPRPKDLLEILDKNALKTRAVECNIRTAKFCSINFTKFFHENEIVKIIQQQIPHLPYFVKPSSGSGSGGSQKIKTDEELKIWAKSKLRTNATYLVEELMEMREFWAVTVLTEKTWYPIQLQYNDHPVALSIQSCSPIATYGGTFKDLSSQFPQMYLFIDRVIDCLKPPGPHLFTVQGFQVRPNSSEYSLTEVTYRQIGGRGTLMSYMFSGISQETAFLSTYMDEKYSARPDTKKPDGYFAHLWYPFRKGMLAEHNRIPEDAPLDSEIHIHWNQPVGAKLNNPSDYKDLVAYMIIQNASKDSLHEDVEWLKQNWKPIIV